MVQLYYWTKIRTRQWLVCVRVFCGPNATILLVYMPAKIKINIIWKYDFFAKIGTFCKSIAGPLSEAYTSVYTTITIAIDCNGLSLVILEKKWPNYASGPKSALNSDLFLVHRLSIFACGFSVPQTQQFSLSTYPANIEMSFIWKDDFFFFAKIGICCKSIAGPLPSVVQAYTKPYSFGERIKRIICHSRHELSVAIH